MCRRIEAQTTQKAGRPGLKARTRDEFIWMTLSYFMRRTGIIINFSITVTLGFIVGVAIAGQTFYTFTLENLNQFGSLKAMGVSNLRLVGMVLFRRWWWACWATGSASGWRRCSARSCRASRRLAFYMPWQVLVGTGVAVPSS